MKSIRIPSSPVHNMVAFLPCRSGSERVIKKNTRPFADIENGLLEIKLHHLFKSQYLSQIIVSTDDPIVMETSKQIAERYDKPLHIDIRPEELSQSTTSTDDLIKYVPTIIETGDVLWTHVTSPFINTTLYDKAIECYLTNNKEGTHDSLMSVTPIQTFLWNKDGPVNYDRDVEKWPRTQTLPDWFEINSGMFIINTKNMEEYQDRIGKKPYLFPIDHQDAFDIDTESHFEIAENIWKSLKTQNG